MVGKISPLVQGNVKRTGKILGLHVAGGAIGGAMIGSMFGFTGIVLHSILPSSTSVVVMFVIPLACLYAGLIDLRLLSVPELTSTRQTPGWFPCALGIEGGVFAWGVDLGLALTTRIPFQAALIIPCYALFTGDLLRAVAVMLGYSIARACAVGFTVLGARQQSPMVCERIHRLTGILRNGIGGLALSLGALLLITLIIGRTSP